LFCSCAIANCGSGRRLEELPYYPSDTEEGETAPGTAPEAETTEEAASSSAITSPATFNSNVEQTQTTSAATTPAAAAAATALQQAIFAQLSAAALSLHLQVPAPLRQRVVGAAVALGWISAEEAVGAMKAAGAGAGEGEQGAEAAAAVVAPVLLFLFLLSLGALLLAVQSLASSASSGHKSRAAVEAAKRNASELDEISIQQKRKTYRKRPVESSPKVSPVKLSP
jgi:hypothetical protein